MERTQIHTQRWSGRGFGLILGLIFTITLAAQPLAIRPFFHYTQTSIEGKSAYSGGLMVDWRFNDKIVLSLSGAYAQSTFSITGGETKTQGGVVIYDNTWTIDIQEKLAPIDLSALVDVTKSETHNFFVGLGLGMSYSQINYPRQAFVEQGALIGTIDATNNVVQVNANVLIQYEYFINGWFNVFARIIERMPLGKQELLSIQVISPDDTRTISYESALIPSFIVGVGFVL